MSTILAVDDSATMRKCLEITFAGTEFNLVACESAEEAIEKVKELSPDLVIADVSLPPKDGYELCSTIKLASPQVPVMILSSKQNPFDPAKGSQADGHIDKPFDTQVLQDRARELARAEGKADTEAPGAPERAPGKPVSMPERAPAGGKIPAPRRKRPTPAMMSRPEAGGESQGAAPQKPAAQQKQPQQQKEQRASPQQGMRRTVPFAMPSGSKRPDVVEAMRKTGADSAVPEQKKPHGDTLPGAKESSAEGKPSKPAAKPAGEGKAAKDTVSEGTPAAAAPAAEPAAAPATAEPAGGAAVAAVSPADAASLEQRLDGLGLTKEQIQGVLSLSRELVEQVVWEVVPVLAETLIKEEIARLTEE